MYSYDYYLSTFLLGKKCEIDINECENNPCQFGGTCFERSNLSLYYLTDKKNLSAIFQQEFSYATANGYVELYFYFIILPNIHSL